MPLCSCGSRCNCPRHRLAPRDTRQGRSQRPQAHSRRLYSNSTRRRHTFRLTCTTHSVRSRRRYCIPCSNRHRRQQTGGNPGSCRCRKSVRPGTHCPNHSRRHQFRSPQARLPSKNSSCTARKIRWKGKSLPRRGNLRLRHTRRPRRSSPHCRQCREYGTPRSCPRRSTAPGHTGRRRSPRRPRRIRRARCHSKQNQARRRSRKTSSTRRWGSLRPCCNHKPPTRPSPCSPQSRVRWTQRHSCTGRVHPPWWRPARERRPPPRCLKWLQCW